MVGVTEADRQLELKTGFVDQVSHRDAEQGDVAFPNMLGESGGGKLGGEFRQRQRRGDGDRQRDRTADRAEVGKAHPDGDGAPC